MKPFRVIVSGSEPEVSVRFADVASAFAQARFAAELGLECAFGAATEIAHAALLRALKCGPPV
jgi:hypothetical protein